MDRGAWWAAVHGVAKEWDNMHAYLLVISLLVSSSSRWIRWPHGAPGMLFASSSHCTAISYLFICLGHWTKGSL